MLIGRIASNVTPAGLPTEPLLADWAELKLDDDFKEAELALKSFVLAPGGNLRY